MEKKWYYDAFISYRHTELDSFVAKNLHKQLESFKLPKNVVRKMQANAKADANHSEVESKTRITRVFRDQEELPLVSNLADPIMEALEKSEFLIVICSPRLKESMWCKKEIETFIRLHDREHVLAVLIEGEPDDSFPEELLYRDVEEVAEDGSIIKKKVPVEPLAADVRGNSEAEIRKKIKAEVLRLAAPMFQCGYDDLRQRHREQRMRKIITASLAGSAVCLAFGVVSTTMALQIKRQNVKITEQSEEIAKQADEIEAQYIEAMRSNCISQAQASANLLEDGDRIGAIETALAVYPGEDNPDIPFTAQANYALAESLRLYEDGTLILPDRMLEADTTINFMKISPEGSKVLTVDDFGSLCVWDGTSGEKLASFILDELFDADKEKIAFVDEEKFIYPTENGVSLYDVTSQSDIYEVDCGKYSKLLYSQENDTVLIQGWDELYLLQGSSGQVLYHNVWAENDMDCYKNIAFSEDGSRYAVSYTSDSVSGMNRVAVYNTSSGDGVLQYAIQDGDVNKMRFVNEVLYVTVNSSEGESFLEANLNGTLYACDLTQDNTFLWTYTSSGNWLYEVSVATKEDSNYMLCSMYSAAVVLDKRNGSYVDTFFFNSEIVKMANYVGTNTFLVFTRDGTWHYVNLERMEDMVGTKFSHCNSNNVKAFEMGDGYCATLPYLDKSVTLYRNALGSNYEVMSETDGDYSNAIISKDGAYLAVNSYDSGYSTRVEMMDTDSGEILWDFVTEEFFDGMSFYQEKELFTLVTSDNIYLLDMLTGEEKAAYPIESISGDYLCSSADGQYVFCKGYAKLYGYDLEDGSLAYEIDQEAEFSDRSAATVSPYNKYYAVASKETNSLKLYNLNDLQDGKTECLDELEEINATYVEYLFFNDKENEEGLILYVVYQNGDMIGYPIDSTEECMQEEQSVTYEDLDDCMNHFIQPEGAEYSILAGEYDAYLISNGELLARIDSFLAADGTKNCIYLTDGDYIYRAPIYTQEELRQEAEAQLTVSAN